MLKFLQIQLQEEEANLKLHWEYNAGSIAGRGNPSVSQPTNVSGINLLYQHNRQKLCWVSMLFYDSR